MLEYMYCGSTVNIENIVESVLALSEKYAIKPLKEFCSNCLASKINTNNLGKTAVIAEFYSLTPLIERCARYLSDNHSSVVGSKGWQELKKHNPGLVIRLLELSK
ncbi:unnamed protein product [Anisakis simplex]|uniref:Protein roadkill (inferred by orthology to a D. melanogaster protein) n=1 Tax=Anisakis simplex TaxID=6269 RepID=A0A0M3JCN2_ANISI|nr:unnamed protein product [Anisakis simplex]